MASTSSATRSMAKIPNQTTMVSFSTVRPCSRETESFDFDQISACVCSNQRFNRGNKLFAARCGALHRLGALDLDCAADALEHGGRRLDQWGDDSPHLLPAPLPQLPTLPRRLP